MSQKSRSVKVGIFVFAGIALAIVAVFLIGDNRRTWDRKVTFHAKFNDVVGLKAGSVVRMGGIDVGSVTAVKHASDPRDAAIYVTLDVARNEARRVWPDTKARIVGKGLLGDKMVELVGGDPSKGPAKDGAMIDSDADPGDMAKVMEKMADVARKADDTMTAVKRTSENLADPVLAEELKGSVKSLHTILDGVAHKDGVAHRMIFDPEQARKVEHILSNLDATSANLAATTANMREVSDRAKTGPGLVHSLVYDEKMANSTAGTVAEMHGALRSIREGNGLAHAVIYGDDQGSSQKMMTNLGAMSDDLREIVHNVKQGRGTIGGLLVDPSVYEDIKQLVGNVERNQVLRALVRYSIKQNEADRPHAEVRVPPAPAALAPPKSKP